jgi:phosphoglycerol transferase MdoB-like AlkP superfamily enzyme
MRSIINKIIFVLTSFTLVRLMLYVIYRRSFFDDLGVLEVAASFAHGLRFDLSILMAFLGLPLLVMALPLSVIRKPRIQRLLTQLVFVIFIPLMAVNLGDVGYFGYVGRHLFDELLVLSGDLHYALGEAFTAHLGSLLLGLVILAGLAVVYMRYCSQPVRNRSWGRWFVLLLGLTAAIRGSVGMKPIGVVNAFTSNKASSGHLTLNGAFTAWHATRGGETPETNFYPDDRLFALLAPLGIDSSKEYPLFRPVAYDPAARDAAVFRPKDVASRPPHIVVIILESFGSYYVDSFGRNGFGATPEFDRIAAESLKFTNFFAGGSRSIEAIQTVLTSFPSLRGVANLGLGFEQSSITTLPHLLRRQGYHTVFAQSGPRGSFRLDAISRALGFDEYFGAEDYPLLGDYKGEKPQFGWDYEMFMFMARHLAQAERPTLTVLFTGTAHTPFVRPPYVKEREGHGVDNEPGFLTLLSYSDYALGAFVRQMEGSSRQGGRPAVYLMTADHMFPPYRSLGYLDRFRVPLLIHGPGLVEAQSRDIVSSHMDILPTVLDLAGVSRSAAMAGHSLLDRSFDEQGFALLSGRYGEPAIVKKEGWLRHSLKKRLDYEVMDQKRCPEEKCLTGLEEQLMGLNQLYYRLFRHNHIAPARDGP